MKMDETAGTTKRGRGRGKTTRGRGASTRARGRGRGRGRKAKVIESEDEHSSDHSETIAAEITKDEKLQDAEQSVTPPADPAVEEKENEVFPPTSKCHLTP